MWKQSRPEGTEDRKNKNKIGRIHAAQGAALPVPSCHASPREVSARPWNAARQEGAAFFNLPDATSAELLHFLKSHVRFPMSHPFAEHIYIWNLFFFSEHTYLELNIQKVLVKVLQFSSWRKYEVLSWVVSTVVFVPKVSRVSMHYWLFTANHMLSKGA